MCANNLPKLVAIDALLLHKSIVVRSRALEQSGEPRNIRSLRLRFVILMTDTWRAKCCIIIIIIIIIIRDLCYLGFYLKK